MSHFGERFLVGNLGVGRPGRVIVASVEALCRIDYTSGRKTSRAAGVWFFHTPAARDVFLPGRGLCQPTQGIRRKGLKPWALEYYPFGVFMRASKGVFVRYVVGMDCPGSATVAD